MSDLKLPKVGKYVQIRVIGPQLHHILLNLIIVWNSFSSTSERCNYFFTTLSGCKWFDAIVLYVNTCTTICDLQEDYIQTAILLLGAGLMVLIVGCILIPVLDDFTHNTVVKVTF